MALPVDRTVFEESANGLRDLRSYNPMDRRRCLTSSFLAPGAGAAERLPDGCATSVTCLVNIPGFVVDLQQPGSLHTKSRLSRPRPVSSAMLPSKPAPTERRGPS